MSGKLKIKGNMMLATKLDIVMATIKNAPDTQEPASTEKVSAFKSDSVFAAINSKLSSASAAEKDNYKEKVKSIFQFDIKVCQYLLTAEQCGSS